MIIDKPDVVYVMENQSVSITITLNHVNASVIWKRQVTLRILLYSQTTGSNTNSICVLRVMYFNLVHSL